MERLRKVLGLERRVTIHRLHDGSLTSDVDLPSELLEDMPKVAHGILRRTVPIFGKWQVDEESIEIEE